jgi:hypothetical protein
MACLARNWASRMQLQTLRHRVQATLNDGASRLMTGTTLRRTNSALGRGIKHPTSRLNDPTRRRAAARAWTYAGDRPPIRSGISGDR